jgi:hypothetical protein
MAQRVTLPGMERARRHQVALSRLAFVLLALITEIVGRDLTLRFDVGEHVRTPSYAQAAYYPFLLALVKVGAALLLARLAWRVAKAHSAERAARRLLAAVGRRPASRAPRVRLELSPRLSTWTFAVTSLIYLVQMDVERISTGRWPLLAPWLHSSALPVFAVLSVVAAVVWRACARWLSDYERYARDAVAYAYRIVGAAPPDPVFQCRRTTSLAPRLLHGVAFQVRPPPAHA